MEFGIKNKWRKRNYKNLGILETETVEQKEIKEKVRKEFLGRMRKLCGKNLMKGINTCAVHLVRYFEPFFK